MKNQYVTYVFRVADEAAWFASGNPLNPECTAAQLPGLVCVGIASGDLMSERDTVAAEAMENLTETAS